MLGFLVCWFWFGLCFGLVVAWWLVLLVLMVIVGFVIAGLDLLLGIVVVVLLCIFNGLFVLRAVGLML